MKTLVHKLLMCRVRPYYIYQCDLINGSSHLRTSVAKGIEIIEGLRGHTTGYAVPQFVIDAPGGGGKVPINPGYILYHDNEKIVIRNYEGKIFEYPETGKRERAVRAAARVPRRVSVLLKRIVISTGARAAGEKSVACLVADSGRQPTTCRWPDR